VNKETKQETCIHYWVIDGSHHGVCTYCGAECDFPTWEELARQKYKKSKRTGSMARARKECT
jgi:hypothetical protein